MLHFIVNPSARSGLGKSVWENTRQRLSGSQTPYQVHFTEGPHHATELVSKITGDGRSHTLVVLGGDGSIDEAVNGIRYSGKTTLGYIPFGSGNDFARGLGISTHAEQALSTVLAPSSTRHLDLGKIRFGQTTHRFAVSAGIGYDADICHRLDASGLKKLLNRFHLGRLAYAGMGLVRLICFRPSEMTVTLDDLKTLHFKRAYFAAAMNLRYEGGGCMFCPNALPDDGYLDLIVIADISKFRALVTILPTVFTGKHIHMKGVHIYRCKRADITSSLALPVHSDGEPLPPVRKISFSVIPDFVHVIVR